MVTKHGRRYTLVDFTIHGELKHPDGWDKLKSGSVCYVHDGMFSDFASGCFSFEDSETGKKNACLPVVDPSIYITLTISKCSL